MFGGEDDITRVDLAEERRHLGWDPSAAMRRIETGDEVIVIEVAAVILLVPGARGTILKFERVQIPLGVGIVAETRRSGRRFRKLRRCRRRAGAQAGTE